MQQLSGLLSPQSHLTHLSLVNCTLKHDVLEVIDAFTTNTSLTHVDLTGNQFGDRGTFALSKGAIDQQERG